MAAEGAFPLARTDRNPSLAKSRIASSQLSGRTQAPPARLQPERGDAPGAAPEGNAVEDDTHAEERGEHLGQGTPEMGARSAQVRSTRQEEQKG